jgi:hypothetical protein
MQGVGRAEREQHDEALGLPSWPDDDVDDEGASDDEDEDGGRDEDGEPTGLDDDACDDGLFDDESEDVGLDVETGTVDGLDPSSLVEADDELTLPDAEGADVEVGADLDLREDEDEGGWTDDSEASGGDFHGDLEDEEELLGDDDDRGAEGVDDASHLELDDAALPPLADGHEEGEGLVDELDEANEAVRDG